MGHLDGPGRQKHPTSGAVFSERFMEEMDLSQWEEKGHHGETSQVKA